MPHVGRKISLLKKEGRPQDQAVAIAMSMERRGDLGEGHGSDRKAVHGSKHAYPGGGPRNERRFTE